MASACLFLGIAGAAEAATFTWTTNNAGNASGSWTNQSNWTGGTLPTTTNDVLNFSTLDITADSTVTLDGNRSVNSLMFGDAAVSSAAGWILNPGSFSTNTLTLGSTAPTITVNPLGAGKSVVINSAIAGTKGLILSGGGVLVLAGTNTYSGGTVVSNGTLVASNAGGSATGTGAVIVGSSVANATLASAPGAAGGNSISGAVTTTNLSPHIQPGGSNGMGTLSLGAGLTLGGTNGTIDFNLDSTNWTAIGGGTNDLISVTGNLAINTNTTINVAFNGTPGGGPLTCRLINYTGSKSGAGTFSIGTITPAPTTASISTSTANQVNLIVTYPLPAYSAYKITPNGTPVAGVAFPLTITAVDAGGSPMPTVNGSIGLVFSGLSAGPDGSLATMGGTVLGSVTSLIFTNGVATANLVAHKVESGVTLAATDGTRSTTTLGGNGANLNVLLGAATQTRVETAADGSGIVVPAQGIIAGSALTVYAIARDMYGNYAGNPAASWSLSGATGGVTGSDLVAGGSSAIFTGHLVGAAKIQAAAAGSNVLSGTQTVWAGPAATFVASGFPSPQQAGAAGTVTVTAKDAYNNTATNYTGTVRITSSDSQAILPANYTYATANAGTHGFSVTLKTPGAQSITATDTVNPSVTGTQAGVSVLLTTTTSWTGAVSTKWSDPANWTAAVPSATVDAIIGDSNFTGSYQPVLTASSYCNSLVLGTGSRACTLTAAKNMTCSGNVVIGVNGSLTNNAGTFSFSGNWTNNGGYYAGASSTVKIAGKTRQYLVANTNTVFRNFTINSACTNVLGTSVTVLGNLTVAGTLDPNESPSYQVTVNGSNSITGTLQVKGASFAANYVMTNTPALGAASTIDYAATNTAQTINSALVYGTLKISGAGLKSLAADLSGFYSTAATYGNLNVAAGTLDLGPFAANRGTTVAGGTLTVASGATLRIGGTSTIPQNFKTHTINANSAIEYYGSSQAVSAEPYGTLILSSASGDSVKTMPASALTISSNLTSMLLSGGTSVSFTANGPITVSGKGINLGPGTIFNGGLFSITNKGSWTNNGAFIGNAGSVVMKTANKILIGSGLNNFNNLNIAAAGILIDSNTDVTVSGNLLTSGTGALTQGSGTGTLTMSGSGASITGTGISLNNVSVPGTITAASSLTINGNLAVDGSLSATAGSVTFAGSGKTISGGGNIAFGGLTVPGNVLAAANFSISGNVNVSGNFSASSGTATFCGTSTLSGTANLFNVTVNGTTLQLGTGATLGIGGALAIAAGTFDVTSSAPNFVIYNGSGPQTVLGTTYNNLICGGAGLQTAGGALTVGGDFIINHGATFNPASYAHSFAGNFINNGSFVSGGDTEQFIGAANASIVGPTTFNNLTINKGSSANVTSLSNNVSAATVNMLGGQLTTGTNILTITSTRTGDGIILGTITRAHAFTNGVPYAFESPTNTITFSSLGTVNAVTVTATIGPVNGFPFNDAINRQYAVGLSTSDPYVATLRLHYEDAELNGNAEAAMQLWRRVTNWQLSGKSANDEVANWVEQGNLSDITGAWTLSDDNNVVQWNGSASRDWGTAANWTAVQGTPAIPPSTNDVAQLGTASFINQPTISSPVSVKSISFGAVQPVTLSIGSGGALTTIGNISGSWADDAAHLIDVGAQRLAVGGDVSLSDGTGGRTIDLRANSGSITIAGSLSESGGASVTLNGATCLSIGGDFNYVSGAFSPGGSSVIYNGPGAQNVAGVGYNNLVFTNVGGLASLNSPATVNGNVSVAGGALQLGAALSVQGNVTVAPGATIGGGAAAISVGGDWTVLGTFTPGASTVLLNGSGLQNVAAGTFNNLVVNKAAGVTLLGGSLMVNGDLTLTTGALDLAGNTIARSVYGGTFLIGSGGYLRTSAGSGFPANFSAHLLAANSSVEYNGSGAQSVSGEIYGTLILSGGGSNAKTLQQSATVAGDLVINTNATFSGASFDLNLQGNFTNHGAFASSSGSVTLTGAGEVIVQSTNTLFNALNIPGSYTVVAGDIRAGGSTTLNGSLNMGTNTLTLDGDLTLTGSLSTRGTVTFSGAVAQNITLDSMALSPPAIVNFNGAVAPVFTETNAIQLGSVNIYNSGGIAASQPWTVTGAFAVASGASFSGGTWAHTFNGAFSNSGTVTSGGLLDFEPSSAQNLRLSGDAFSSSGTVQFGGSSQVTLSGGPASFSLVYIINTNPAGITPVSNWQLADDLRVLAGATFNAGAGLTHTMSGDIANEGTFNGQTSTLVLNSVTSIGGGGATVLNNLTITSSGAQTNASDFKMTGSLTNNGSFDGNNRTITFSGNSPAFINGSSAPNIDFLAVSKAGGSLSLGVSVVGLTAVTVGEGILDVGSFSVSTNGANGAGTLSVYAGAALKIGGAGSLPAFSGYNLDSASTIEYGGTGAQTIAGQNYGNLTSSSSGARVFDSINPVGISGVFTPGGNSYTIAGSTINYNGSGAQTIPAFNYNNLTSSGNGSRTLAVSGSIGVAGTFTPGNNAYVTNGSTINFNGAGQVIPVFGYFNLATSGSGTKTLGGNIRIAGDLGLSSGTLADGGFTATVNGNAVNTGTHSGPGEILFSGGSTNHVLSGGGAYANLELNDPAGALLSLTNLTVNGRLRLTAGSIATATNRVVIPASGVVQRTNGFVIGNLQKNIPTGASVTQVFEVGTSNGSAQVSLAFTNVTASGDVTVAAKPGDHPAIGLSGFQTNQTVRINWTISETGLTFSRYSPTFSYNAGDLDSNADANKLLVGIFDGSTWSYPHVGTRTMGSVQALNLTVFGDFQLAQNATIPPTLTAIATLPGGLENVPCTISYAALLAASDAFDIDGKALSFRLDSIASGTLTKNGVSAAPGATLLSTNEAWVWTPAPYASGNALNAFAVRVFNGSYASSNAVATTINVAFVNQPPTLNAIANLTINEDAPAQQVSLSGISVGPAAESGQSIVSSTATSSNPALIPNPVISCTSGSAAGALTLTPAPHASGVATITVILQDNGGTANGGVNAVTNLFTVTVRNNQIVWAGDGVNDIWSTNTTPLEWLNGATPDYYWDGDNVSFTQGGVSKVAHISGTVVPASITVNAAADYVFDGPGKISGGTGLTKNGAGKLTIATANDFAGLTTINGGTLALDKGGSLKKSAVVVNSGGALTGCGTVGSLTINNGGAVAPGASPGALNVSDIVWVGGGIYNWEINDAAAAAGADPGWDVIEASGDLNVQSSATNRFTIRLVSLSGNSSGWAANFDFGSLYTWPIAIVSGTITNFDASRFTVDSSQFQNFLGGGSFSVATNGNSVVVVFTPRVCLPGDIACSWVPATVDGVSGARMTFGDCYGLGKVVAFNMTNCVMTGTAFGPGLPGAGANLGTIATTAVELPAGTTNLVLLARRSDPSLPGVVNARVWDVCDGYSKSFDPVLTTLTSRQGGVQQVFGSLMAGERFVRVRNASPGLLYMYVVVNGQVFALRAMADNEEDILDVGAAMIPGNGNTIALMGFGLPGASAEVTIAETLPDQALPSFGRASLAGVVSGWNSMVSQTDIYVPSLTIAQEGAGVSLSWPASAIEYEAQGSTNLMAGTNWVTLPGAPAQSNGWWMLRVDAGGDLKLFRLRSKP